MIEKIIEINTAYFSSGVVAWVALSVWLSFSPSLCCIVILVGLVELFLRWLYILTFVYKRVDEAYVELRIYFSFYLPLLYYVKAAKQ